MGQLGLTGLDLSIIVVYLIAVTAIGFAMRKRAAKSVESYLLGGKDIPWYMLGLSNASGCSTSRDHVAGHHRLRLWSEKHLAAMAVADLQPDLPDGLSVGVAASVERHHRCAVDRDPLRHRHRRPPVALDRGHLRADRRARFPGLRFCRSRQVRRDLHPVGGGAALSRDHIAPQFVPHFYGIIFTLVAVSTPSSVACDRSCSPTYCSSRS